MDGIDLEKQNLYGYDTKNRQITTIDIIPYISTCALNSGGSDFILIKGFYVDSIEKVKDGIVKIDINGQYIVYIPIYFLINKEINKINNNKFYIDFWFYYFFQQKLTTCLNDIRISFDNISTSNIQLLIEYTFITDRSIDNITQPFFIKQIQYHNITNSRKLFYNLNSENDYDNFFSEFIQIHLLCHGLFIDLPQTSFKRLKIQICATKNAKYDFIDYYDNLINLYTIKVGKMTFIPFNSNKLDDFNFTNCISGVGIEGLFVNIFLDKAILPDKINIYLININEILFKDNKMYPKLSY